MNFEEWLIAESAKPTPNPHAPPHLRMMTVDVNNDWLQKQYRTNRNPKMTFKKSIQSEKTLEFFVPGNRVWINVEGGQSFLTRMDVKGLGPDGSKLSWHDTWSRFGKEPIEKLEITIDLANQEKWPKEEDDAYLAGYNNVEYDVNDPSNLFVYPTQRKMTFSNPQIKQAYFRGQYDLKHFYAYGTSMPGVEPVDRYSSYSNPTKRHIDTHAWSIAVFNIIDRMIRDTIERRNLTKATQGRHRMFSDWDTGEIKGSVRTKILEKKESLGVQGVQKLVDDFIDEKFKAYINPKTDQQYGTAAYYQKQIANLQPPEDPDSIVQRARGRRPNVTAKQAYDNTLDYYQKRLKLHSSNEKKEKLIRLNHQKLLDFPQDPVDNVAANN